MSPASMPWIPACAGMTRFPACAGMTSPRSPTLPTDFVIPASLPPRRRGAGIQCAPSAAGTGFGLTPVIPAQAGIQCAPCSILEPT